MQNEWIYVENDIGQPEQAKADWMLDVWICLAILFSLGVLYG